MSFAVRKFLALLPTALFSSAVWYGIVFCQSLFAGNFLGDDALAALNVILSFAAIATFVNMLIANGAPILFSLEMGRADRRRAREFVTQGYLAVLLFSVPIALFFRFGHSLVLDFLGVSPGVGALVRDYLSWFWIVPVIEGLLLLTENLVAAEGDTMRGGISFAVFAAVDVGGTYFGLKLGYGLVSCSCALLIAELLALAALATHLFSPSNTLGFPRHFAFADLKAIVTTSFGDAVARLCTALTMFFMTKLVILNDGADHLAVLQIAALLWGLDDFFQGVSTAMQPLVTVYHGEGNPRGIRATMRGAVIVSLAIALLMTVALFVFPSIAATALGLTEPTLIAAAERVVRLTSPVISAIALVGLFNSYFMCIEHSPFAVLISVLSYLILPIGAAALGAYFASDWLYLGFALGPLLGLLVAGGVLRVTTRGRTFPLLLDRQALRATYARTLKLTEESVVEVSRTIGSLLKGKDSVRSSLLVEEVLLAVRDRNLPRSVLAEVTLRGGEAPELILRDDGVIFDITDADAKITSLRGFVVASLMEKHLNRLNLITTGYNRNVFRPEADEDHRGGPKAVRNAAAGRGQGQQVRQATD